MTCAFCYYGVVLISTEILGENSEPLSVQDHFSNSSFLLDGGIDSNQSFSSMNLLTPESLVAEHNGTSFVTQCKNPAHKMLTTNDYVKLLWTTLAEFPGC